MEDRQLLVCNLSLNTLFLFLVYTETAVCNIGDFFFYPLFEEKVGIVLLSGSEVGIESELSRRFEVP